MPFDENLRQWTVKGVSLEAVELARASAKSRGERLGPWMEKAIRENAKSSEGKFKDLLSRLAKVQKSAYDAYMAAGFSKEQALQLTAQSAMITLSQT